MVGISRPKRSRIIFTYNDSEFYVLAADLYVEDDVMFYM